MLNLQCPYTPIAKKSLKQHRAEEKKLHKGFTNLVETKSAELRKLEAQIAQLRTLCDTLRAEAGSKTGGAVLAGVDSDAQS